MFTNDPKLNPRLPSPTSFNGVKPSHVEWSEELLTYLSVTDSQEFVPILQAVTGHTDVIAKKVFTEGSCQSSRIRSRKKREKRSSVMCQLSCRSRSSRCCSSRDRCTQRQESVKGVNMHESRQLSQVCSASLNVWRPQHHGSSHHETI